MADDYLSRLQRGLALERSEDSIESVTSTVAQELQAFDPNIRLKRTGYFNHSYIPDLVASWPDDPSADDRYVFLKYEVDVDYLLDDVELVRDTSPIVFRITDSPAEKTKADKLDSISSEGDTLVTGPAGLEELISRRTHTLVKLFSAALAQGGRGLLDHNEAGVASATLLAGMDGAMNLDPTRTGSATSLVDHLLTTKYSGRVSKLLQAVWIGAGGSLSDFPGSTDLSGDLSDDALNFLLSYEDIDDGDFWRRLAPRTGVRQLGRVDLPEGSSNLTRLIHAGQGLFYSRSCKVRPHDGDLFEEPALHTRWRTDRDLLTLEGPGYMAYFGESSEDTSKIKTKKSDGLTIAQARAISREVKFEEAEMTGSRGQVSYSGDGIDDVRDGNVLEGLASTVGTEPLLTRAMASAANSSILACDFTTSTLSGRTNSRPQLSDVAYIAVLTFTNPGNDHVQSLRDVVAYDGEAEIADEAHPHQ